MRSLTLLLLAALSALAQNPACVTIDGDQILGADLTRALPAFRAVAQDARIAPAPLPGGMRILSGPELENLGLRFGLRLPALTQPVCFRVATAPLNPAAVVEAMQKMLALPEARIEIMELSSEPAPGGTLRFPPEMLGRPAAPDAPTLWRGEVVSGMRHFNVWARVRILAPITRIVATEQLPQGVPVQSRQVVLQATEGFPGFTKEAPLTVESVVGLLPAHTIAAGGEVRAEYLNRPLDVARGEMVRVDVRLGKAHLALNARAESAGRMGDVITVRNPQSSRVFQARIEGKGRVLVEPQSAGGDD